MYTQSITRSRRTAFFLAIDCSGSMAEPIRFRGRPTTKAEAVASVANGLLFELIERARRSDGVRNYYDIAVLGYSGDDEVSSLLPGDRDTLSVTELAAVRPDVRRETVECRLPDGGIALRELPVPVWIEPRAAGQTPMCEALRRIRDLAAAWCADPSHAESFPPIVFNITDGEASDSDEEELAQIAGRIRSLGTDDGRALLVNIHLASGDAAKGRIFLTDGETAYNNRYARLLYDISSPMPPLFDDAIRSLRGDEARGPFRGMCYNASITELLSILNVGSISVNLQ